MKIYIYLHIYIRRFFAVKRIVYEKKIVMAYHSETIIVYLWDFFLVFSLSRHVFILVLLKEKLMSHYIVII